MVVVAVAALMILAASRPGVGSARGRNAVVSAGSALAFSPVEPAAGLAPRRAADPFAPIVDPAREPTGTPLVPTRPVVTLPEPPLRAVPRAASGSTAVYLGDSFTSGWAGAGIGTRSWPRLVGAELGWRTVNLAVPGTGFLNPGWTNQAIGSRVAAAIAAEPDVVVVAGGHNDSRWSATATADAADRVIDRLRAALPDALLVIVAPIWQDGSPPLRCLILRDQLRLKAASVGAVFIDPLADGWFAGGRQQFIGPDGLHPTNAGHRHIASRVLAALEGIAD